MTCDQGEASPAQGSSTTNTTKRFLDSSFFRGGRASVLPAPEEVRTINVKPGDVRSIDFRRPPPVKLPALGLLVRYGANTTTVETKTQRLVYDKLQGKVPVPEVYPWAEEGGQVFI
jgi:hypothetical protein